jgi:hypothetical protein
MCSMYRVSRDGGESSADEVQMSRGTATVVRGARAICQARFSADRPESVAPNGGQRKTAL